MTRTRLFAALALGVAALSMPLTAAEAALTELDAEVVEPPQLPDVPDELPGLADPDACVRGPGGKLIACVDAGLDEDGRPQAKICGYDDLMTFYYDWYVDNVDTCTYTSGDWSYLGGAGACSQSFNSDDPQACVNGHDECLLWTPGAGVKCWPNDLYGPEMP